MGLSANRVTVPEGWYIGPVDDQPLILSPPGAPQPNGGCPSFPPRCGVVQLVEHPAHNRNVAGSSPAPLFPLVAERERLVAPWVVPLLLSAAGHFSFSSFPIHRVIHAPGLVAQAADRDGP